MGTWGTGNLDSDSARDALATRTSDLVRSLWQRAHRPESRETEEDEYTELFVELELVFALDAAGLLRETRFPAASEVRALVEDFVAAWRPRYAEMGPTEETLRGREAVIRASFERFAAICAKGGGQVGAVPR